LDNLFSITAESAESMIIPKKLFWTSVKMVAIKIIKKKNLKNPNDFFLGFP
jgi:hypothetical protein